MKKCMSFLVLILIFLSVGCSNNQSNYNHSLPKSWIYYDGHKYEFHQESKIKSQDLFFTNQYTGHGDGVTFGLKIYKKEDLLYINPQPDEWLSYKINE